MTDTRRKIALLGSTGSIGVNTLDVIRNNLDKLSVGALVAGKNWKLLAQQIIEFKPRVAVIFEEDYLEALKSEVKGIDTAILSGMDGILEAIRDKGSDTVFSAMVGAIGLRPVLEGINSKKTICLANKEPLVVGGGIVMDSAKRHNVQIIPVDSEHSAIFQCLHERPPSQIKRLILTASGGPFRKLASEELERVTVKEALNHPNWDMGGKITIDSATLMNKGLEVIEAHWLFGIDFDRISVIIHPQSIIHSMVEFIDGSIIAQLGAPDMRGPIQYALSHPERWPGCSKFLDIETLTTLSFEQPRLEDFPCLAYAFEAGRANGSLPCIMNAANEVAVEAFLQEKIGFMDIPRLIRKCMDEMPQEASPTLERLLAIDQETRIFAQKSLELFSKK